MEEEYMKDFISGLHCGFCGEQCLPDNIDLMEHNGDQWVFSVFCNSCKKQGYVTAILKKGEEPGFHPELTMEELNKFGIPVSSDEILDMHNFLKEFDGDFSELFPEIKLWESVDNCSPEPQLEL